MKNILILLIAAGAFGCSVQKRKYQKGFYVGWKHHKTEETLTKSPAKETREETLQNEQTGLNLSIVETQAETRQAPAFVAVADGDALKSHAVKQPTCDLLIFADGTELEAKVTELNDTEVKYIRCDMPDGPVYSVRKSSLFMIKYANGTREIFKTEKPSSDFQNKPPVAKRTNTLAILALIFGILGIWPLTLLGSIAALIMGTIAIRQIRRDPDQYKGYGMALAGQILGAIIVGLFLIFLLIFIIVLAMTI